MPVNSKGKPCRSITSNQGRAKLRESGGVKGLVVGVHSLTVFLSLSLFKVDSEFETVATQLLKRTQAMLNKYRCLLLEDAMVKFH